jgi:hypothetical protein
VAFERARAGLRAPGLRGRARITPSGHFNAEIRARGLEKREEAGEEKRRVESAGSRSKGATTRVGLPNLISRALAAWAMLNGGFNAS